MAANFSNIINAILGGQAATTGLGTQAPDQLGPSPVRTATSVPGIFNPQNSLQSVFQALAPYIATLSGGGSTGTGAQVTSTPGGGANQLLASLIQGLTTPPTAGAPAPSTSPTTPSLSPQQQALYNWAISNGFSPTSAQSLVMGQGNLFSGTGVGSGGEFGTGGTGGGTGGEIRAGGGAGGYA